MLTLRSFLDARASRERRPPVCQQASAPGTGRGIAVAKSGMRPARRRGTRGMTMVEIMVALGIGAVLLGIAVPSFTAMRAPYALRTATTTIASDVAVARMRAIAQNRRQRLAVSTDADTWVLQQETAPGTFESVGGTRALPTGCTFGAASDSPIFDTRGMLAVPASLEVSGEAGTKTISVNVLGQATITDGAIDQG